MRPEFARAAFIHAGMLAQPAAIATRSAATAGVRARVFDLRGSHHHGIQAIDCHPNKAYENGPPIDPLLIRGSVVPSVSPIAGLAYASPDTITFKILES